MVFLLARSADLSVLPVKAVVGGQSRRENAMLAVQNQLLHIAQRIDCQDIYISLNI